MMRPPTASGHSIDFEDLQTSWCYCACSACQRTKHKYTQTHESMVLVRRRGSSWCSCSWSQMKRENSCKKMQSGVRWLCRGHKWMLKEVLLCSNVRGWYKRKRTTTMVLAGRISLLDYCFAKRQMAAWRELNCAETTADKQQSTAQVYHTNYNNHLSDRGNEQVWEDIWGERGGEGWSCQLGSSALKRILLSDTEEKVKEKEGDDGDRCRRQRNNTPQKKSPSSETLGCP